jgi:hypothetical protein
MSVAVLPLHLQLNYLYMIKNKLQLLFTAATLCISVVAVAQTTDGKLLLVKGQKIQIDNSVKSVTSMELMGQSMEMTSDVAMVSKVEVKDKVNDTYTVTNTLTKLATSGSAMGQDYSFDSDKKEDLESEIGKVMKDQLNVSKEMEYTTAGKLAGVKKPAAGEPAAKGNPMMDMMKNMSSGGNDESGGTSDIFMILPSGKKVGDTWSDSTIADGSKTYRTYLLKELKGNVATLTLTGTQSTNKKMEQQGMEVMVTLESKLTGELILDIAAGLVTQKSFTMDGTGSADAMGQAIPITTKITSATNIKNL